MACTIGPLTLSSFTATVLARGPVPGSPLRIATRAAPQRLKLAPPAPFCTLGSAAPSSTARPRSTLDCTSSLRHSSRAHLPMQLSAPLHSAHGTSQYALHGSLWLGLAPSVQVRAGSAHAPNRQVTGFGKGRVCLSAPYSTSLRRPGCGCSAAGWRPSAPARQDVRHG